MPNEALERLMACLLASIAKKKKWKKRELLLLSLHPLNKLKHNDTEQVQKKILSTGADKMHESRCGIHNSAKRVLEGRRAPKARWGWAPSGGSHKLERKGERDDRLIYSKSG